MPEIGRDMSREAHTTPRATSDDAYEKYPFLEDYREFFGPLSLSQILWEGQVWIIIAWPHQKVYKIGNSDEHSKLLEREYENHKAFYKALRDLPQTPHFLRVPEIAIDPIKISASPGRELFIYEMERVAGVSLKRLDMMSAYRNELSNASTENRSDMSIVDYLVEKHQIPWEEIDLMSARGLDILEQYFPLQGSEIRSILNILEAQGLRHGDLHSGNIMIARDDRGSPIIYVIDFGFSEIPKQ